MVEGNIGRICFYRLLEGEDLAEGIKKRAEESNIKAGMLIAIGSLKEAVLGHYNDGKYKSVHIAGPVEIASCMGNVAIDENGEVIVHVHAIVSNEEGETFGGHLMKDSPVGVMAELIIIEAKDITLQRIFDEKTKLRPLKLG